MSAARDLADWVSTLRYEDIPPSVLERARLQVVSVIAAVLAGSKLDPYRALLRSAERWGTAQHASLIPGGDRVPIFTAAYVNAAASVALDYDDYLFAGHTGHSAVLGSLAFAEATAADGRALITAQVAANEVAGRLGASFLLGPHNGQMWAYIHALAGAVVGGRFLGPDARAVEHAIGIALAQPPWPLAAGFFGPDSKMLLASEPLAAGMRAASLASEGLTGGARVIEEMLEKVAARALPFITSGLGSSWVTDSLAYKVIPGCAYIDTPVEAMAECMRAFTEKHGRALTAKDITSVRVECTLLTAGMEMMSAPHRDPITLRTTDVNFSAALSIGVLVANGELTPGVLARGALEEHATTISSVASRVTIEPTEEMNARMSGLASIGIDVPQLFDPGYVPSLVDADFSTFQMAFPARATLVTSSAEEYVAEVDVPKGAPGRPFGETSALVGQKFLREAEGTLRDPARALEMLLAIDESSDVREVSDVVRRSEG